MKLRQTEFCHNCNQQVEFEFEDTTNQQIIYCPLCGHEHYRELDEGTIINIRVNPQCKVLRVMKTPKLFDFDTSSDVPISPADNCEDYEEHKILGNIDSGVVVESKEGDTNKQKVITGRRWGRDPRQ